MKTLHFFPHLLLAVWICSCTTPLDYLELHQYDKAFDGYAKRFEGARRMSLKDVRRLETAFLLANKADSLHADSLLKTGVARHVPIANQAYRNILRRKQKADQLLPISTKNNYQPVFSISPDIDSLEQMTRLAAAEILYQNSLDLLSLSHTTGQRQPARQAWAVLKDIHENYYPTWKNTPELLDSALNMGLTHVVIQAKLPVSFTCNDGEFTTSAGLTPEQLSTFWQKCYTSVPFGTPLHYRVEYQIVQLNPGISNTYTRSTIENKEIEVRTDETKDSTGHIVSRKVIMETVTASINEDILEQTGNAEVHIAIFDAATNQLLQQSNFTASFTYKDVVTNVTGDRRALTHAVFENIGSPTAPGTWTMLRGLGAGISGRIRQFIHSNTQ